VNGALLLDGEIENTKFDFTLTGLCFRAALRDLLVFLGISRKLAPNVTSVIPQPKAFG
jgi:hypothetical protein